MPESSEIHYVDVAIRVQFKPEMVPHILAVARKLMQENAMVPVSDDPDDDAVRRMTDEEVAEEVDCVQSSIIDILQENPLFKQLELEIIGSCVAEEETADDWDSLPDLDVVTRRST
jgi:hypothetical protein